MFALDLFNNDHERRLAEGAVDQLEQRRIDDLAMKMDDLVARAKQVNPPAAKAALMKEFQKCKAERDSYFKIKDEGMGYGTLAGEGQVTPTATGLKHHAKPGNYGGYEPEPELKGLNKTLTKNLEKGMGVEFKRAKKFGGGIEVDETGIPGSVPAEKIPGKEALLRGRGRSYYEAQDQQKNSKEVNEDHHLAVGDPVIVTAPNEYEGKTGEIAEFSPSGKFVVVDLYNHGRHSMHLSDIEYNQYAADQEDEDDWYDDGAEDTLEEANVNPQFIVAQVTKLLATEARRITNAPMAQLLAPVMKEYNLTLQQIDGMMPGGLKRAAGEYGIMMKEGFQDFNKVEPYAVCLAGKPVKKFDYYEDARRFHDNWKKKLYNQGDKAKADKITLMPLNLDEAAKKGLYYYVNKRKAAGTSRSKNNPKAPTAQAWKDAAKTAKKEDVAEAGSPAQQAAIAIAKKKEQGVAEGNDLTHAGQDVMVWLGPPTNNPPRDDKKYWIRGKLDSTEMHGGSMRANVMTAKGMYNPELSRVFKAEQGVAEDTDSWFRVTVKTPNGKNRNIQVPANSHGTAKRKALAYCAKNGITGAEFVSAMRMPTLDEQGVAEGLSSDRRAHLDSLIDAYRNATDPEAYYSSDDDYDDPDNIIAQIRSEFGDKIADTIERGPSMHFPRPNHAWQQNDPMDPMFDKSPRVTKSGKVNRQDVNVLKKNIQRRVGDHTRPNLPEQGVAEASYINGHVEDPESLRWKQTSMSYEQAVAKFGKNNVKQDGKNRLGQKIVMVLVPLGEQAETDYQKKRQRERDVDAGKPVAKQCQSKMTDYQKRRAQQKREMELGEATGGNYEQMNYPNNPTDPYVVYDRTMKAIILTTKSLDEAKQEAIKWAEYDDIDVSVIQRATKKSIFRVNGYAGAEKYLNEEQDTSGVERAILNRIMVAHTDLLMKFGPEKVMQAAEEVAYNVGDLDEIGTSDVSAWVHEVKQILGAV
jgi:hypothetical protein